MLPSPSTTLKLLLSPPPFIPFDHLLRFSSAMNSINHETPASPPPLTKNSPDSSLSLITNDPTHQKTTIKDSFCKITSPPPPLTLEISFPSALVQALPTNTRFSTFFFLPCFYHSPEPPYSCRYSLRISIL